MDEEKMDVRSDHPGLCCAHFAGKRRQFGCGFCTEAPFAASGREMALAFFMYLPAYLYLQSAAWCFPVFCALFCAMAEWFYRGTPRADESWFWLGCLAVEPGWLGPPMRLARTASGKAIRRCLPMRLRFTMSCAARDGFWKGRADSFCRLCAVRADCFSIQAPVPAHPDGQFCADAPENGRGNASGGMGCDGSRRAAGAGASGARGA